MCACSTDDICTHATCMLYTITMEMKLFLVPLNILVSLDQLKFVYKFCLRFTQVNSVFDTQCAVLSFCSLTDYDLALIPLIQTFLEICFVSYPQPPPSLKLSTFSGSEKTLNKIVQVRPHSLNSTMH